MDPAARPDASTGPLSVREHMALQVEAMRWKYRGLRESYIREMLGWSETRHAQVVNDLIDRIEAIEAYPMVCSRLRRLRDLRRVRRTAARSAE